LRLNNKLRHPGDFRQPQFITEEIIKALVFDDNLLGLLVFAAEASAEYF